MPSLSQQLLTLGSFLCGLQLVLLLLLCLLYLPQHFVLAFEMEDEQNDDQLAYSTQLPVSKIKKIAKLHPDTKLLSAEAVQTITFACEKFVGLMAEEAYHQAQTGKRKTIQIRDIEYCVRNTAWLEFLDGALEDWPEFSSKSKSAAAAVVDESGQEGEEETEDVEDAHDGSEGEEEHEEETDELQTGQLVDTLEHSPEAMATQPPIGDLDIDQFTSFSLHMPESEDSLMDAS